ncbi:LysR substrate-binding domain-containing protein [soil metagenome]
MELRHIRYFMAVAETGSLTEAAQRRLFTSQPSLSRQIRDLEEEVGVPLLKRSPRGVDLTPAGRAFLDYARLAVAQVEAAVEAARNAAQPAKQRLSLGFLTGEEMTWLPEVMRVLRGELPHIEVVVSSDYSPDLGAAVARGKLDAAFMRAEPAVDLAYRVVEEEPLVVLMPSDHRLAAQASVRPEDLAGEPYIAMANKAKVLRSVIDAYLRTADVDLQPAQEVDNPAMVMSLVASTRGIALIPAYAKNLVPWSVVSRPLAGDAPTIGLVIGYNRANQSPVLHLLLSRVEELVARVAEKSGSRP